MNISYSSYCRRCSKLLCNGNVLCCTTLFTIFLQRLIAKMLLNRGDICQTPEQTLFLDREHVKARASLPVDRKRPALPLSSCETLSKSPNTSGPLLVHFTSRETLICPIHLPRWLGVLREGFMKLSTAGPIPPRMWVLSSVANSVGPAGGSCPCVLVPSSLDKAKALSQPPGNVPPGLGQS